MTNNIANRNDLLILLENHSPEERYFVLEDMKKDIQDEIEFALRQGKQQLAIWKMSVAVLIDEELNNVESLINESMYQFI